MKHSLNPLLKNLLSDESPLPELLRQQAIKITIGLFKRRQMHSIALRNLFRVLFQIDVGLYSYGCFDPKRIAPGTTIGRYCSFAPTSYVFNGNHGLEFLSLHPFSYNPKLKFVSKETILRQRCTIHDDVWVGHNACILPNVTNIGRGAVLAAGAVVTKNVPSYAIVAGNPAAIVRYRFDEITIEGIESTRWWEKDDENLRDLIYSQPELVFNPIRFFRKE